MIETVEMSNVRLTGRLICKNLGESQIVKKYLPKHTELSLAEPGCLLFDVSATEDPLIWSVNELFVDTESFKAHQVRVATSEWGRMTAEISREYTVTGAND